MISDRLLQISTFINPSDSVIDIGCDHALLDIYLFKNNLCSKVLASDINSDALKSGINNISKAGLSNDIRTIVSDGLQEIDTSSYNSLIISGMGAHTIKHILSEKKKLNSIKKIIIQSNNELDLVRTYMNRIGYYLENEKIVYDRKHYYSIMCFIKSIKKNSYKVKKYGILKISHINYYEMIIKKNNKIIAEINKDHFKKKRLKKMNNYYLRYIRKIIGRKLENC